MGASYLTDELRGRIVTLVKAGNYPSVAAAACGVPNRTWYRWMADGKESADEAASPDTAERQLWHAIKEAHGHAETVLINAILTAALSGEWQAAAWLLERTRGSRYVKRMAPEDREAQSGAVDALAAAIKAHRDRKAAG